MDEISSACVGRPEGALIEVDSEGRCLVCGQLPEESGALREFPEKE